MTTPMGIGNLSNFVFKSRRTRYTFAADFPAGKIPECFVKISCRPEPDAKLHQLTTTYYELEQNSELGLSLFEVIRSGYKFAEDLPQPLEPQAMLTVSGTGFLKAYDGCGTLLDEWTLFGVWPKSVNFGELNHSSSEVCTVEATWSYDRAEYHNPTNLVPGTT